MCVCISVCDLILVFTMRMCVCVVLCVLSVKIAVCGVNGWVMFMCGQWCLLMCGAVCMYVCFLSVFVCVCVCCRVKA
jgi:hypothetical protein